ncbi:hypothetical protein TNCV_3589481 [Trichonephila clavipes]|nr:hypothetical protein TNCV_3589481 [Trichonephila clavipes]
MWLLGLRISLPARSCGLGVTRVTAAVKIELRSELRDLSDDDNAANKTYESRILEEESSSDESDQETHGNICNGKSILDPYLP